MYLRDSGFTIEENCMSQARWKDGFFSGAGDGVVSKDGIRYVCEYKTANDASFKALKRGQLESIKPLHFAQMQINGDKFNCTHAIYLCVNKNTDELFCDVIEIDPIKVEAIKAKAQYVTLTDKPPPRIASKPSAFQCKFCNVKDVCWGFELPRVHCYNCVNAVKYKSTGAFGCEVDSKKQLDPAMKCDQHVYSPFYMQDAYGWNVIEFHPKERAVQYEHLINGPAPFGVPSKELKID